MKYLLPTLSIGLAIALASPAAAQPLDIIVRGGTPEVLPGVVFDGNDYVYGPSFFENPNFDPGAAAINALNITNPRFRARRSTPNSSSRWPSGQARGPSIRRPAKRPSPATTW